MGILAKTVSEIPRGAFIKVGGSRYVNTGPGFIAFVDDGGDHLLVTYRNGSQEELSMNDEESPLVAGWGTVFGHCMDRPVGLTPAQGILSRAVCVLGTARLLPTFAGRFLRGRNDVGSKRNFWLDQGLYYPANRLTDFQSDPDAGAVYVESLANQVDGAFWPIGGNADGLRACAQGAAGTIFNGSAFTADVAGAKYSGLRYDVPVSIPATGWTFMFLGRVQSDPGGWSGTGLLKAVDQNLDLSYSYTDSKYKVVLDDGAHLIGSNAYEDTDVLHTLSLNADGDKKLRLYDTSGQIEEVQTAVVDVAVDPCVLYLMQNIAGNRAPDKWGFIAAWAEELASSEIAAVDGYVREAF